jgi:chorismate-pyruvate lyase
MSDPRDTPDLAALLGLFPSACDVGRVEYVSADAVPSPYHGLLVHEHHMTVTVEAFYGGLVDVRILEHRRDGDDYARKILLTLQDGGRVVQYGIVRIRLSFCSSAVREAILAGKTPLGRVLIEHDVMRRIEPTAFLRVEPGPTLTEWFGLSAPEETFGRLAIIHCEGQPAIELLEIVAPWNRVGV